MLPENALNRVVAHDIVDTPELNCVCRGTMIRTPSGDVPVETLLVGDMVSTYDNGAQTIRWIGSRAVVAGGALAPVVFEPGAVNNAEELRLSPRHRIVQTDESGQLKLVAAQDLVNGDTIRVANSGKVEYFHIVFDRHEIIYANGVETESFHPMMKNAAPRSSHFSPSS